MGPSTVLVEPASYLAHNERLFAGLEALYPVRFLAASEPDRDADGALLIGTTRAEAEFRANRGIPCLLVPSDPGLAIGENRAASCSGNRARSPRSCEVGTCWSDTHGNLSPR